MCQYRLKYTVIQEMLSKLEAGLRYHLYAGDKYPGTLRVTLGTYITLHAGYAAWFCASCADMWSTKTGNKICFLGMSLILHVICEALTLYSSCLY